jgi:hypothetical protein
MTAEEFRRNLEAIRGLLDAPQPTSQGQQLSPQQHNAAAMHRPTAGVCKVHGVEMKLNEKDGRHWYSHWCQDEGRWCKGR